MNSVINMTEGERRVLFEQVALKKSATVAVIEKDFWVCWVLGRLFSSTLLRDKIIFKGGTSLSKVFGVIERFSEDIDLILDWDEVVAEDPNEARSNTRQDRFNKHAVELSREYIAQVFLPEVQRLVGEVCTAAVEEGAPDVINIGYPSESSNPYLRPEIRLEIGPLAQWVPNAEYEVLSYVAEVFPDVVEDGACCVRAIKAERTFWEKATILHQEAFRPLAKPQPSRFSRHYYDLAMMAQSKIKEEALADLELLRSVVSFKQKFYPRNWARYDLACVGTFRLVPDESRLKALRDDYIKMRVMIYGDYPSFDRIIEVLEQLEEDINREAREEREGGCSKGKNVNHESH